MKNNADAGLKPETITEWTEKLTEIGLAMGLKGTFFSHFGFDQMLERAKVLNARREEPEPEEV